MFTGIIAAVGRVTRVAPRENGLRISIDTDALPLDDVKAGDSIAVNGVCLTVVSLQDRGFDADVSQETLACTAGLRDGASVNLEKALRLSDRLGGHLVSGHVDGIGKVARYEALGDNRLLQIELPESLARYVARKGSIAIDGVSLTVNDVSGRFCSVNLIPHTLAQTNLDHLRVGMAVNVEVDLLARYIERMNGPSS